MPRESVAVNDQQILISPDVIPPDTSSFCLIAFGQVYDEQLQQPPGTPVCVATSLARAKAGCLLGGLVCVSAVPRDALPALATQSYPFTVTLSAPGYVAQTISASIGPEAGFPAAFTSLELPDVNLRWQPTVIVGRVVRQVSQTITPLTGVSVSITMLWRILPVNGAAPVPEAPNIAAVQPPIGLPRTAGVDSLSQQAWTPVAATSKLLLQQALAGSTLLNLQDAAGITVGETMVIDAADPALAEVVTIAAAPLTALANQPAQVTVASPLLISHGAGAIAQQVTLSAPGPANAFAQNALPGDSVVFLNSLNGLSTVDTAAIAGAPPEFHSTQLFSVTTDANGYYRLPPIARVYQITITADDGLGHTLDQTVWPDYTIPENQFDFIFQ